MPGCTLYVQRSRFGLLMQDRVPSECRSTWSMRRSHIRRSVHPASLHRKTWLMASFGCSSWLHEKGKVEIGLPFSSATEEMDRDSLVDPKPRQNGWALGYLPTTE